MLRQLHCESNMKLHDCSIRGADVEALYSQRGAVVWLTGLSGAGKSTVAFAASDYLRKRGFQCSVLDGDRLRTGLCADLGFSAGDRKENIRRAGQVASLLIEAGVIVFASLISPFSADRMNARKLIGEERFIEVYCACPLEVCEARDVKGLYQVARQGKITDFTGISSPYEAPVDPALVLYSNIERIEESVQKVVQLLIGKGILYAPRALADDA